MSDQGYMFAIGPCWSCKNLFSFDPDLVPSIPIDPVTQRPSDMGGEPSRVEREPICETCVGIANENRARTGLPLIDILPGAYGP